MEMEKNDELGEQSKPFLAAMKVNCHPEGITAPKALEVPWRNNLFVIPRKRLLVLRSSSEH
jgi:hypothetical protein